MSGSMVKIYSVDGEVLERFPVDAREIVNHPLNAGKWSFNPPEQKAAPVAAPEVVVEEAPAPKEEEATVAPEEVYTPPTTRARRR